MPIRLNKFGGEVPRIASELLPEIASTFASNVDLRNGQVRPINIAGTEYSMHTVSGGSHFLKPGVPSSELVAIPKPPAPTRRTPITKICRPWSSTIFPPNWLSITAYHVRTYLDENGALVEQDGTVNVQIRDLTYTDAGLSVRAEVSGTSWPCTALQAYNFHGPIYQFTLTKLIGDGQGGPAATVIMPELAEDQVMPFGTPMIPVDSVPLFWNDVLYGNFQVVDANGPNWGERGVVYAEQTNHPLRSGFVTFTINLNYTDPFQRQYRFVQTLVDDSLREGPPSEMSDVIIVNPGEVLELNTPRGAGGLSKNNLYRAGTSGGDFLLNDSPNANTWLYTGQALQSVPIPPFGNYTESGAGFDDFLSRTVYHPAQFAASFNGKTLWLSDVYRFHAWPEEYTIGFSEDIQAIASVGSTIVVFTDTKVYAMVGSNPAALAKYELSGNNPLLAIQGLAKIDQTLFWPSEDGMVACNGSSVEIITREIFTREQWSEFEPAQFAATTFENSVLLEHASDSSKNLRLDIGEGIATCSRWTAKNGVSAVWRTKVYRFDRPEIFDWVMVSATDTVDMTIYRDGSLVKTMTEIESDRMVSIGETVFGHSWQFEFQCAGTIKSVDLVERAIVQAGEETQLNAGNVGAWPDVWIKYPDRDAPVAGILTAMGAGTFYVDLKSKAGDVLETIETTDGHAFRFSRTINDSDYFRVGVRQDANLTSSNIDGLSLFTRGVESVNRVIRILNDVAIPPWWIRRYEPVGKAKIVSVEVHAESNVTMNVYLDGSPTVTHTVAITDGNANRVTFDRASSFDFDFNGNDHLVSEIVMVTDAVQMIGDGPLVIGGVGSWIGNKYCFPDRGSFAAASVSAGGYPCEMKLYRDGSLVYTKTVTNGNVFWIDRTLATGAIWEISVTSASEIYVVTLYPWRRTTVEGNSIRLLADDAGIPWAGYRFDSVSNAEVVSGIIKASSYPVTLRLYADSAATPTSTITVSNQYEFRITGVGQCSHIDFDLNGDDYKAREIIFFMKETVPIKHTGWAFRGEGKMVNSRRRFFEFPDSGAFSVLRVEADDYTGMSAAFYRGGVLRGSVTVADSKEIRLPDMGAAREWEVDIANRAGVNEVHLIGRIDYPTRRGRVKIQRIEDPFSWLGLRIISDHWESFSCGRIVADAYPITLNIRCGDRIAKSIVVHGDRAFRIPKMPPNRQWEIDVLTDPGILIEEVVLATAMSRL